MKKSNRKQIVIVGAGLIGSTMAIALASKGFDVTIVDGAEHTDRMERNKGRTYALSRTSKNLLFNLGLWNEKKLNVCPIKNIVLSTKKDSSHSIRHLTEFNEHNSSIDPSSYMIEDFYLRNTLAAEIDKNTKIQLFDSSEVIQDETNNFETRIMLSDRSSISAEILIISDGRNSSIAKRLNKRLFSKSYNQVAIVGNLSHDNAHNFIAHQIFLSGGPLAILPLRGKRSTFVWSLPIEIGKKLSHYEGEIFTNHLKDNTGDILTNPSLIGEKKFFPLNLTFLRDSIDNRKIFIGDSSQAIHPLAGQGLNIGLRDVASLVDTLLKGKKLGLDLGGIDLLKTYESWRSFDRISLATYTDLINALFSNNNLYLKAIRDFGMNAIDKSQTLKSFFTKEAAGEYGDIPDLMK